MTSPMPDHMTVVLPKVLSSPCCCIDTAKKIETEVGGAMIKGIFVTNEPAIDPTPHVQAVAMMEATSSYPTRLI